MKKLLSLALIALLSITCLSTFVGCGNDWEPMPEDQTTITVAASPTPHEKILQQCVPLMQAKGFTLKIMSFTDYIQPNNATEYGDVDANYFQHLPYLNQFNADNGTHLVSVGAIHYEPLGIYKGKCDSLDKIANGDTVVIPNDGTNRARALLLLEQVGLITLKDGAGIDATKQDIASNPLNLNIVEMEAKNIPSTLQDSAVAVINGNYALDADLTTADAIAYESATGVASNYANVLCVRDGNQNHPAVLALLEVLHSQEIVDYINTTFKGSVVPSV